MNVKKSRWRTLLRNVFHWDFLLAGLVAASFLILTLRSSEPLEDATGPLAAGIALGLGVGLGAAVAARWLTDRLKDDAYGEVLRALDPDESTSQAPFRVVMIIGIATAATSAVLLISHSHLDPHVAVTAYAVVVFFALYGLFGMLDLLLLSQRHQRRQATLRALREQESRRCPGEGSSS